MKFMTDIKIDKHSKKNTEKKPKKQNEESKVDIKQRIIGAIVLVSLGIIFIPLILNGSSQKNLFDSGTNIPVIPDKLKRSLPQIPQPDAMPDPKKIISYPVTGDNNDLDYINHSAGQINSDYKKVTAPETNSIDTVYAIQVGSFTEKNNALDLRDKLKKKNFKAYVELVTTKKGHFYRLRIGPYLQFKQISNVQKKLELQLKLDKTEIVKYKRA